MTNVIYQYTQAWTICIIIKIKVYTYYVNKDDISIYYHNSTYNQQNIACLSQYPAKHARVTYIASLISLIWNMDNNRYIILKLWRSTLSWYFFLSTSILLIHWQLHAYFQCEFRTVRKNIFLYSFFNLHKARLQFIIVLNHHNELVLYRFCCLCTKLFTHKYKNNNVSKVVTGRRFWRLLILFYLSQYHPTAAHISLKIIYFYYW